MVISQCCLSGFFQRTVQCAYWINACLFFSHLAFFFTYIFFIFQHKLRTPYFKPLLRIKFNIMGKLFVENEILSKKCEELLIWNHAGCHFQKSACNNETFLKLKLKHTIFRRKKGNFISQADSIPNEQTNSFYPCAIPSVFRNRVDVLSFQYFFIFIFHFIKMSYW